MDGRYLYGGFSRMLGMSEVAPGAPLDVVETTLGEAVTVQLKDGQTVHGTLEGYDQHLNLVLSGTDDSPAATTIDDQAPDTGDDRLVVRGQMVVTITQPPTTPETSEATGTDDPTHAEETTESDADNYETPPEDADTRAADLAALHERLTDHGLDVQSADNEQSLIVTKLGQEYRVRPGEVVGDGPHRQQIEALVAD